MVAVVVVVATVVVVAAARFKGRAAVPPCKDRGAAPRFRGHTAGPLCAVQFDNCQGAALPNLTDFRCVVEQASDADFLPVEGVGCTLSIQ